MAAAFTNNGVTPTIKRLVENGNVNYINQGDKLGRTPLQYAVMNGNTELVELLLDSGADTECVFLYLCTLRISQKDYNKWNKLYSTVIFKIGMEQHKFATINQRYLISASST